jgi:hypothetical protein
MEIAKTILHQIKIQDRWALSSWGATNSINLGNGVQFDIRTPFYPKGVKIRIQLNNMDTYDIEVIQVSGEKVSVLETKKDIYCDMLIGTIDSLIEKDMKNQIFID